jgi:hypothetical protein
MFHIADWELRYRMAWDRMKSNLEPPSRLRRSLRLKCLGLRLASSVIVEERGRYPWWVSRPYGLLRLRCGLSGDTHDPGSLAEWQALPIT